MYFEQSRNSRLLEHLPRHHFLLLQVKLGIIYSTLRGMRSTRSEVWNRRTLHPRTPAPEVGNRYPGSPHLWSRTFCPAISSLLLAPALGICSYLVVATQCVGRPDSGVNCTAVGSGRGSRSVGFSRHVGNAFPRTCISQE